MPNTIKKLRRGNIKAPCPSAESKSFSLKSDKMVIPFIICLLLTSCPDAVFWKVSEGIVFAFYCMLRGRSWSHISIECQEGTAPAIADSNATSPIIRKAWGTWLCCPLDHFYPYGIFRGTGFCRSRHAMRSGLFTPINTQTTAAFSMFPSELAFGSFRKMSAFTLATPSFVAIACAFRDGIQNCQSSKLLTCFYRWVYKRVSHVTILLVVWSGWFQCCKHWGQPFLTFYHRILLKNSQGKQGGETTLIKLPALPEMLIP